MRVYAQNPNKAFPNFYATATSKGFNSNFSFLRFNPKGLIKTPQVNQSINLTIRLRFLSFKSQISFVVVLTSSNAAHLTYWMVMFDSL